MATAGNIEIGIKVTIPDETVERCLRILEMWMDDNPDKDVVCDLIPYETGFRHEIHIETINQDEIEDDDE